LVFRLGLSDCLPLHVRRGIFAAACERHDVIDHVARPSTRVAGLPGEGVPRCCAALDAPAFVSGDCGWCCRRRLTLRFAAFLAGARCFVLRSCAATLVLSFFLYSFTWTVVWPPLVADPSAIRPSPTVPNVIVSAMMNAKIQNAHEK